MELKQQYSMQDLLDIVELLRDPDRGCPWDKAQTHESIRSNFIEETYEVADAIDLKDNDLLCEELGDVLLQVALHTQMEKESGNFSFNDITSGICKKLIMRHPHVFGDVSANTPGEVLQNWEAIKRAEKSRNTAADDLDSVPLSLPALMRSHKVQKRAANYGFCYKSVTDALNDLESEIAELKAAVANCDNDNISEEIGDVLFSCVNVARFLKVDAELALNKSTTKFTNRLKTVEVLAAQNGKQLKDLSLCELDDLYKQAKVFTKP